MEASSNVIGIEEVVVTIIDLIKDYNIYSDFAKGCLNLSYFIVVIVNRGF